MNISDFTDAFGISRKATFNLIANGAIKATKQGRLWRIHPDSVEAFKQRNTCEGVVVKGNTLLSTTPMFVSDNYDKSINRFNQEGYTV